MTCTVRRVVACLALAAGCADGDESPSSSSTLATTTAESSDSGTSTATGSSTSTSSTSEGSTSESSGAVDSTEGGSSSGSACPAGTLGCPCDMDACESDGVCVGGTCEAFEMCFADMYEPNDDEDSAVDLGAFNDDDDNGGSVAGILDHATDADWYTYEGDDDVGYVVDPTRELVSDAPVRLCKFAECLDGLAVTEANCPPGVDIAMSPNGRPGCCSDQGWEQGEFNCADATEDSARIFIRVDQAGAQCVQYTVNYHF